MSPLPRGPSGFDQGMSASKLLNKSQYRQELKPAVLLPKARTTLASPAPFESMPAGLRQLHDLGGLLGKPDSLRPDNFRVVVSVPTKRLASTALALGAVTNPWDCDSRCDHRVTDTERRAASLYDNRQLRDQDTWRAASGRVYVSPQNSFSSSHGVHLLPRLFPRREPLPRGQLFQDELEDLAEALDLTLPQAGMERSELGAHPVIVVGYVSQSFDDARLRWPPLARRHPLGRLAPGKFGSAAAPGWYRHPVLLANRLRDPDDGFTWLREVEPRLVIYVGMSSVSSSIRDTWPRTPAVVVTSRRDRASANSLELIENLGWSPEALQLVGSVNPLQPGSGLEISQWSELTGGTAGDVGDEGPEW